MKKCVSKLLLAGLAVLAWAGSTSAQTIPNPSFEADTFVNFPGYVSGNSPITGWTAGDPTRAGINPGGGSPFADNGTIPAGSQVAFIQNAPGSFLETTISGLTPASTYRVTFRVNARGGNLAILKVDIGANNIINTEVNSVGGANPYRYFAFEFTAAAASETMTLRNDSGGDNTVLIDDFSIALQSTGWSYAAWTDDASSGVDPLGTYTHAYNFGSGASATINGILFTGVAGGNPSTAQFSTAGLANPLSPDGNNVTGVGGSRVLADSFCYSGNLPAPQSITINGLIPGAEYEAMIYSVGWDDPPASGGAYRAATFSVGNDRLTMNQDQFGNNGGIRFRYHYFASASSITLTYVALRDASIHTYGFSNNQLAAPPTAPQITSNPQSRCVSEGQPFTLTGAASGAPAPTYKWQKEGFDIPGATSSTLTIDPAFPSDGGNYTLVADNGVGSPAVSAVAVVKVGLPMANPSFEVDTFTVFPGYVSGNGGFITGWSALGGHGINPGGGSPFADNGTIPDRNQVAFMQQDGPLSQTVSGFAINDAYYLEYQENARNGNVPALEVKVGSVTIVPAHVAVSVGGSNPYRRVASSVFLATANDLGVDFIKSNPLGGDNTVLIDNVCIVRIPPNSPPEITDQPKDTEAAVGQTASFHVGAIGSPPLSYQWKKGLVNVGGNSPDLVLNNVQESDEALYSVVVTATGSGGSVASASAKLTVLQPIPTLLNTGVSGPGAPLAAGQIDPHWVLAVNADHASADAFVHQEGFPISPGGPWLANDSTSKWISPLTDTTPALAGDYVYSTTFNLANRVLSTVFIEGRWSTDNLGLDIRVNGVSTAQANNAQFVAWTPFSLTTANATFVAGDNTLEFVVNNAGPDPGWTGLRVEFTKNNADVVPGIPPSIVSQPQDRKATVGETVTFSVVADGSLPLTYTWRKNGVDIAPPQNSPTLTLPSVSTADSGNYSVRVSNGFAPDATSTDAKLCVIYNVVPGVFGTGLDVGGGLLQDGDPDANYVLTASADLSYPGPIAYAVNNAWPIAPAGPWVVNGPASRWIAPRAEQDQTVNVAFGNNEGDYTFQTTFDLTGVDPSQFKLEGAWSVDNTGIDILINGASTGITSPGFGGMTPFTITSGFVAGVNTLDFKMNNAPTGVNPAGLRVDLKGLVNIQPHLTIALVGPNVSVAWSPKNPCQKLQRADFVIGPWTEVVGALNPHVQAASGPTKFFRVVTE